MPVEDSEKSNTVQKFVICLPPNPPRCCCSCNCDEDNDSCTPPQCQPTSSLPPALCSPRKRKRKRKCPMSYFLQPIPAGQVGNALVDFGGGQVPGCAIMAMGAPCQSGFSTPISCLTGNNNYCCSVASPCGSSRFPPFTVGGGGGGGSVCRQGYCTPQLHEDACSFAKPFNYCQTCQIPSKPKYGCTTGNRPSTPPPYLCHRGPTTPCRSRSPSPRQCPRTSCGPCSPPPSRPSSPFCRSNCCRPPRPPPPLCCPPVPQCCCPPSLPPRCTQIRPLCCSVNGRWSPPLVNGRWSPPNFSGGFGYHPPPTGTNGFNPPPGGRAGGGGGGWPPFPGGQVNQGMPPSSPSTSFGQPPGPGLFGPPSTHHHNHHVNYDQPNNNPPGPHSNPPTRQSNNPPPGSQYGQPPSGGPWNEYGQPSSSPGKPWNEYGQPPSSPGWGQPPSPPSGPYFQYQKRRPPPFMPPRSSSPPPPIPPKFMFHPPNGGINFRVPDPSPQNGYWRRPDDDGGHYPYPPMPPNFAAPPSPPPFQPLIPRPCLPVQRPGCVSPPPPPRCVPCGPPPPQCVPCVQCVVPVPCPCPCPCPKRKRKRCSPKVQNFIFPQRRYNCCPITDEDRACCDLLKCRQRQIQCCSCCNI